MLTDKQKEFLDNCEDPAVLALWILERAHSKQYDQITVKNIQQMSFRGAELMHAAGDYLYHRAIEEINRDA